MTEIRFDSCLPADQAKEGDLVCDQRVGISGADGSKSVHSHPDLFMNLSALLPKQADPKTPEDLLLVYNEFQGKKICTSDFNPNAKFICSRFAPAEQAQSKSWFEENATALLMVGGFFAVGSTVIGLALWARSRQKAAEKIFAEILPIAPEAPTAQEAPKAFGEVTEMPADAMNWTAAQAIMQATADPKVTVSGFLRARGLTTQPNEVAKIIESLLPYVNSDMSNSELAKFNSLPPDQQRNVTAQRLAVQIYGWAADYKLVMINLSPEKAAAFMIARMLHDGKMNEGQLPKFTERAREYVKTYFSSTTVELKGSDREKLTDLVLTMSNALGIQTHDLFRAFSEWKYGPQSSKVAIDPEGLRDFFISRVVTAITGKDESLSSEFNDGNLLSSDQIRQAAWQMRGELPPKDVVLKRIADLPIEQSSLLIPIDNMQPEQKGQVAIARRAIFLKLVIGYLATELNKPEAKVMEELKIELDEKGVPKINPQDLKMRAETKFPKHKEGIGNLFDHAEKEMEFYATQVTSDMFDSGKTPLMSVPQVGAEEELASEKRRTAEIDFTGKGTAEVDRAVNTYDPGRELYLRVKSRFPTLKESIINGWIETGELMGVLGEMASGFKDGKVTDDAIDQAVRLLIPEFFEQQEHVDGRLREEEERKRERFLGGARVLH